MLSEELAHHETMMFYKKSPGKYQWDDTNLSFKSLKQLGGNNNGESAILGQRLLQDKPVIRAKF
jgi:hypothetical protein